MTSYTANVGAEKPDRGAMSWASILNNNADLFDSAIGALNSTVDDLPQTYRLSGTFNSTTGVAVSLPREVDSANEYTVEITPTTRAGSIGDIWVVKGTSSFTVYCSAANTSDTFETTVSYLGDVSSYGGAMYRRYYVSPSTSITDHANAATAGSIAYMAALIGSSPAMLVLPGNKTYTIDSDIDLSSKPDLILRFDPGAVLDRTTGDEIVTFASPKNIAAQARQKITSDDMIVFEYGGTVYPQWWGALGDGSTNDSAAIQNAIDSLSAGTVPGGRVWFAIGQYNLGSTGITIIDDAIAIDAESPRFVGAAAFGVEFLYSGTGVAVTFGQSGTINYRNAFRRIQIRATGTAIGSATAVGMKIINQHYMLADEFAIKDFGDGIGMLMQPSGTGCFGATCQFRFPLLHCNLIGVRSVGVDSSISDNHAIFFGGAIIGDVSSGSIGVDLQQYSDGYIFYGTDIESYETGFKIDGTSHRSIGARTEFCTTAVNLTANSVKNVFLEHQFAGAGTQWVDSGAQNVRFSYGYYYGKFFVNASTDGSETINLRDASEVSLVNLDTTPSDPKLMLGNGATLEMYPDNFITQKFRIIGSTGAVQIGGNAAASIVRHLSGFAVWDPPSIAAGSSATTTVTVTGATTGGNVPTVVVGADSDLQGLVLTGYVSAADTVTVVLFNPTAAAVNLSTIYVRTDVWEH